jgi:replicative DNA helicase
MAETPPTKIPPNSKESEMIVLGCMLTAEESLNVAADLLEETDFYYSEHQLIFDVLKFCFSQDKPADVHIAAEELKRRGKLKQIGGVAYLTTLAQYAGTAAHIEEYVDLVRNKSVLRRMIHAAQDIEKEAFTNPENVEGTLDTAQQKFFHISQSVSTSGILLIKDLLSGSKATSQLPYLKELQERQERFKARGPEEGTITGIPTHFLELDKMINGLSPSNLMILAARPAMGKTALALNLAENICFKNNLPVGVFSLEMTAEQLLHRIICSQSEVESDKIRTGALSGIDYQRVVSSVNMMQNHTMVIDDQPGLKITDLRARARRMKEAYGIEFLVIDYLQLLTGSGNFKSQENRQLEVSEISRLLKTLARELNIPILCLSQLSRKVEERTGHRPMISDLRESGCLTGDTLIKDAETGKLHTLKKLAERKEQTPLFVYGVDQDLKLGKHRMLKAFYSGRKVVYELKTRTGRTIKASANHPFLKLEGWSRLDTLKRGDRIALPRSCDQEVEEHSSHPHSSTNGSVAALPEITKTLSLGEIAWDEILSIKELGEEDVYDATVETVHNFVANDIIVHNSIEQDSDLVMLLLRRDYYDPYDKPGTAELIVAKNRHGSIGNINLAFRKEVAKFGNYSQLRNPDESENDEAFRAFTPN